MEQKTNLTQEKPREAGWSCTERAGMTDRESGEPVESTQPGSTVPAGSWRREGQRGAIRSLPQTSTGHIVKSQLPLLDLELTCTMLGFFCPFFFAFINVQLHEQYHGY